MSGSNRHNVQTTYTHGGGTECNEPYIIEIPTARDNRGNLSALQTGIVVPFDIARCYWLYDIPSDGERDGHAMLSQSEMLIAISGSVDVITETAAGRKIFHLDRPFHGLLIPPLTWREIENCTSGTQMVTVSSGLYDELDYVRSYKSFLEIINANGL